MRYIVNKYLLNCNSKVEGQRLSQKWFTKNNIGDKWGLFESEKIYNTKSLYNFLYDTDGSCICGSQKRYKGFSNGYQEYCDPCGRRKNNHMSIKSRIVCESVDDTDFKLRKHAKNIISALKNNKKYSSTKILNLSIDDRTTIISTTFYLSGKFNERLYHIEQDLFEIPKCKCCGVHLDNFASAVVGYSSTYCKINKCAYKNQDRTAAKMSLLNTFFRRYIKQYKKTIGADYNYIMFGFDEYAKDQHAVSVTITHKKCNHIYIRNVNYQGHLKCPKCYPIRSRIQYEIYDELSNHGNFIFNDRQLLKPKEIDILSHENKFGIEYDSLNYHSTGFHAKTELNNIIENKNYHVQKTNNCELLGYQLFRIFSNEWVHKQEIWKSVINSKLNKTNRVFARKCVIKELNSKESNNFIEQNHLQGKCNASIRLGLYYQNELVSVMTFGKSRYNKSVQYELIRFCSKLNTTVVGGASRLLKYFELNYKPESIISYANRRWSTGSIYEILGFAFIKNTPPNYFYFKGGDNAILLSREQFQKHKLKDKLEIFDPELTESLNMYNNKYRKIYDCGNKVYIKQYR